MSLHRHVKEAGEPTSASSTRPPARRAEARAPVSSDRRRIGDRYRQGRPSVLQQDITLRDWLASDRPFPEPQIPLIADADHRGHGVGGIRRRGDHRSAARAQSRNRRPNLRAQVRARRSDADVLGAARAHRVHRRRCAGTGDRGDDRPGAHPDRRRDRARGDPADRSVAADRLRRTASDAAREVEMACGSLMAGLAMNISDCTAEHSLAQAIGARQARSARTDRRRRAGRRRSSASATTSPAELERVADALGYPEDGSATAREPSERSMRCWPRLDFPVLARSGSARDLERSLTALRSRTYSTPSRPCRGGGGAARSVRAALRRAAGGRAGTPYVEHHREEAVRPSYDAVIVGAGFSGSVRAARAAQARALGPACWNAAAASGAHGSGTATRAPAATSRASTTATRSPRSCCDEWRWTERYAAQPEILRYLNHVADRFDLRRDIQLETDVDAREFDDGRAPVGRSTTEQGERFRCALLRDGGRQPVVDQAPEIPGLDEFKGEWLHTARWPRGRRRLRRPTGRG